MSTQRPLVTPTQLTAHEPVTHPIDERHQAFHELLSLLFVFLAVGAQIGIVLWKQKSPRTYMKITLLGFWLIPFGISVTQRYWRMITLWTLFTSVSAFLLYKATRRPLERTTPRMIYTWFFWLYWVSYATGLGGYIILLTDILAVAPLLGFRWAAYWGIHLLFYGLYFGVLDRDCAELCTDSMSAEMGTNTVVTRAELPSKRLNPNMCVICNEPLLVIGESGRTKERERIIKMNCGHECHDFCLRGWTLIGKKDICPYPQCKEKVDMKMIFTHPWTNQSVLWMNLLVMMRYLIVWYPIIVLVFEVFLLVVDKDFSDLKV